MKIHDLYPAPGSNKRKKRVGRGPGSGHGKTSTKGHKGQHARSGGVKPPGFEGGQMPLILRIPKRGFKSPHKVATSVFNIATLEEFDFPDGLVSAEALLNAGLVKPSVQRIKILAEGEPTKPYIIQDLEISKTAQQKIEAAGGSVVSTLN
ncbi:MAG: 50S ribosomal protein L15 [Nitrospirae bacterium]|jgi:large subunit ribosomal protein L15|nr:50S ribosomal protein L15 [Nitrospirota bacterium]